MTRCHAMDQEEHEIEALCSFEAAVPRARAIRPVTWMTRGFSDAAWVALSMVECGCGVLRFRNPACAFAFRASVWALPPRTPNP